MSADGAVQDFPQLGRAALAYASRGYQVFPVAPSDKIPLSLCDAPCFAKLPARDMQTHQITCKSCGAVYTGKRGLYMATTDAGLIAEWWSRYPDANIGVRTGNKLMVLDVDGEDGERSLSALLAVHGDLPATPVQTTGKGRHYFFAVDVPVQNGASVRGLGKGLDIRGDGGYVIVTPSRHPNGSIYGWEGTLNPFKMEPASAPDWLMAKLASRNASANVLDFNRDQRDRVTDEGRQAEYVAKVLQGEYMRASSAAPGTRNDSLNLAAFNLGTLAETGLVTQQTAFATLEAAVATWGHGIPRREVEKIHSAFHSGLTKGGRKLPDFTPRYNATQLFRNEPPSGRDDDEREAPAGHGLVGQWIDQLQYVYEPEIVEELIPSRGVGAVFGASSAGKSFVVVDWAMSIASGGTVLDRYTVPSGVLYFAAEGQYGLRKRMVAARKARNLDEVELPFNVLSALLDLSRAEARDIDRICDYAEEIAAEMEARGAPLRVVFIDTLAAAAPGANENAGEDMGPIMQAFHHMSERLGVVVVLVAHTGKDESRGIRGWSGIRANLDFAIECKVEKNEAKEIIRRSLYLEKAKDGPDGIVLTDYHLSIIELGRKQSGKPDTTCCVEYFPPRPEAEPAEVDEAAERQAAYARRAENNRACIFDAMVQGLGEEWRPLRDTRATIKALLQRTIGDNSIEALLKDLGRDVVELEENPGDDLKTYPWRGKTIEVRSVPNGIKTQYKFRVVSDEK